MRRWTVLALALPAAAQAHAIGVSRGEYAFDGNRLGVSITFARGELASAIKGLDADGDGTVSETELKNGTPLLSAFFVQGIRAVGYETNFARAALTEGDGLVLEGEATCAETPKKAVVRLPMLDVLPKGHRHIAHAGATEAVLFGTLQEFTVEASTAAASPLEGVARSVLAPESLLFLVALALGGGSWRRPLAWAVLLGAGVIGGSLAAPLASVGPTWLTIAGAILVAYAALENWSRGVLDHRWVVAALFGVTRGLALSLPNAELAGAGHAVILCVLFSLGLLVRRSERAVRWISAGIILLEVAWVLRRFVLTP